MKITRVLPTTFILPKGVSTSVNGTDHACTISELILCLKEAKKEVGDLKIGVYDNFEGMLYLRTEDDEKGRDVFIGISSFN